MEHSSHHRGERTSTGSLLADGTARELRVLHVSPSFYPATYWGGPIFSLLGLCNGLGNLKGISQRVLTTNTAGPGSSELLDVSSSPVRFPAGFEVYYCRRSFGVAGSPELLIQLSRMVRWADVVHLTAVYSFPTIPTLLACRLHRKPVVWSPRGALQASHEWADVRRPRTKSLWEWLCSTSMSKDWILHVTSEVERVSSLERIPRLRAALIPNGVDLPHALPSRDWMPRGNLRLMFIGRLDPKKGIENLLQALRLLSDKSVSLNIYGAGDPTYTSSLVDLVRGLDLDDRVAFRGFADKDGKRKAFLEADVCIVPSHSENFANVVPEALSFGVPVIVSKGAPWQELEARECGLWVDNSPESLRGAINTIRKLDLAQMGAKGRRWVGEAFSWDVVSQKMLDTYQQLCFSHSGLTKDLSV